MHILLAIAEPDAGVFVPLTLFVSVLGACGSLLTTVVLWLWRRAQHAEASARRQRDDEVQSQLDQVIKRLDDLSRQIAEVEDRHGQRIDNHAERIVRLEVISDLRTAIAKGAQGT
jgi:hypothetical protein